MVKIAKFWQIFTSSWTLLTPAMLDRSTWKFTGSAKLVVFVSDFYLCSFFEINGTQKFGRSRVKKFVCLNKISDFYQIPGRSFRKFDDSQFWKVSILECHRFKHAHNRNMFSMKHWSLFYFFRYTLSKSVSAGLGCVRPVHRFKEEVHDKMFFA